MPRAKGSDGGGVRTVDDLRMRCVVDEDTHCWLWRGATRVASNRCTETRVWVPSLARVLPVPRAAWIVAGKRELQKGETVWRRCSEDQCCNPAHLMAGDKAAWGAFVASKGLFAGRPERSAINRAVKINSGCTSITMELAAWARESDQMGVDVAHALGVSSTVVTRIRKMRTFAPVRTASVFNLAQFLRVDHRRAA